MTSSDHDDQAPLTMIITCQRERDRRTEARIDVALARGDSDEAMRLIAEMTDEPTEEHECDECRAERRQMDAEGDDD